MRPRGSLLKLVAAAWLAGPAPAFAEVVERKLEDFYVVNARPDQPVRALIVQATRIRINGQSFHGVTNWHIGWRMYWQEAPGGECRMTRVVVTLQTRVEVPRLFEATDAQRAEFDGYIGPLLAHERGHVAIARSIAGEVDDALSRLPPMEDCDALEDAANALGMRIVADGKARQAAFDRDTGHGSRQGVWLP